jgi:C-terminal processing protease CtpA/Prc
MRILTRLVLTLLLLQGIYTWTFAQAPLPNTLTTVQKIYALSKFWNEVNYNFIYLDKMGGRRSWDSAYQAMIPEVLATKNDWEYYRILLKFCALLHDGHTNIWLPNSVGDYTLTKMFGKYWLSTQNIGGKAIVNRVLTSELKDIPLGTEIIEVNGVTTAQYAKDSVAPYISSSTDYVIEDGALSGLLFGLTGQSYVVKFKRPNGSEFTLNLTHAKTSDTSFYPPFPANPPLLELKWYKGAIAYVSLNSFGDRKIDSLFLQKLPELYAAKGLIIDLRNNGGGSTNIGTDILQYLTADTIWYPERSTTRQHVAAFKAWGAFVNARDTAGDAEARRDWLAFHDQLIYDLSPNPTPDTIHLNARRLVVPTVLLTGHNTASAAEDFLIYANGQKNIIRIGERSYGSTGQPYQLSLGGGINARICTKKDTYYDGTEFVGYGVKPDIEVIPTVQDYLDQKDPALAKALQYLGDKTKNPDR